MHRIPSDEVVQNWASRLGLLPVPLDDRTRGSFVMLNGTRGNFCLSERQFDESGLDRVDVAWSVNVGHFVTTVEDRVEVVGWGARPNIAHYRADQVVTDFEKFHAFLESDQPSSEASVVAHVVRIYRKLRACFQGEDNGHNSMLAFLWMLSTAAEVSRSPSAASFAHTAAEQVRREDWELLFDELMSPGTAGALKLIPHLLLRHAAGQVFQDAHYEALRAGQLRFPGFGVAPARLSRVPSSVGVHFTPPALARTVVEQALRAARLDGGVIKIFDPACGSGEFLKEALRQLRLRHSQAIHLIGRDISPIACEMAKFSLEWERLNDSGQVIVDIQHTNDSLTDENWPVDVDIVLMNPPFVPFDELSHPQREAVSSVLGPLQKGRVDLSSAFVWKAVEKLKRGGVIGTIIPASFLDGDSSSPIRRAVSEVCSPILLARLGSHILFTNAIVDAAIYVGINDNTVARTVAFWADHRSTSNSTGLRQLRRAISFRSISLPCGDAKEGYSIYENENLGRTELSWSPRPFSSWRFLNEVSTLPVVGDLFSVHMGARSGHLAAHIITKKYWASLSKSEKAYFRPAILNESIIEGTLRDSKYVFYPYGEKKIHSETQLRSYVPSFYNDILKPAKAKLASRSSRRKANWWEMSEARTWQHSPTKKIVSVYFGEAGSFAWDETGDYIVVQGFAWLPRPGLFKGSNLPSKIAMAYLAILNSDVMNELLSACSNPVRGGQWNLSAKYVDRIPMPDLAVRGSSSVREGLSALGKCMHYGEAYNRDELNELVRAVYGGQTMGLPELQH